ncbi:MAG: hypothetical protein M3Q48_06465, partial [Actinomycetota bacterium]|nr:hypothetical protein [Actinomycetota bacterium]
MPHRVAPFLFALAAALSFGACTNAEKAAEPPNETGAPGAGAQGEGGAGTDAGGETGGDTDAANTGASGGSGAGEGGGRGAG